jgi:TolA-binding protein
MSLRRPVLRLLLIFLLTTPLILNGCSYIPWIGDDEDDLAFEEDFPFEEDRGGKRSDDDFFGENSGGFEDMDRQNDSDVLQGDVVALQTQQEVLVAKVRELEEGLGTLEPKVDATQERLEGSLSAISGTSEFLEPEVEELKLQIARLKDDIARLQSRKTNNNAHRARTPSTPPEYDRALSAYRSGKYDESILMFQDLAMGNPPVSLKDNIEFWIGSGYVKLGLYDDAIRQFQTVINSYPGGNKAHDSRYMLGLSYYRSGESSRAVEIFEAALRHNPPAEVRSKITKQLNEIQ